MPTPGRSLLRFLDEQPAIDYLRGFTKYSDDSDSALRSEWQSAQRQPGASPAAPGAPDIRNLAGDTQTQAHLRRVAKHPRYRSTIRNFSRPGFRSVELAPLLAFQLHVADDNVTAVMQRLGQHPSPRAVLQECLPDRELPLPIHVGRHGTEDVGGIVFISDNSFNLGAHLVGDLGPSRIDDLTYVGIKMGPTNPFVTVCLFGGRYHIINGYHRAVALLELAIDHAPCLLVEAANYAQVNRHDGGPTTIPQARLTAADPPTVQHLRNGYSVPLRLAKRVVSVSWQIGNELEP